MMHEIFGSFDPRSIYFPSFMPWNEKPRLRIKDGIWCCAGQGNIATGVSPKRAYANWVMGFQNNIESYPSPRWGAL